MRLCFYNGVIYEKKVQLTLLAVKIFHAMKESVIQEGK